MKFKRVLMAGASALVAGGVVLGGALSASASDDTDASVSFEAKTTAVDVTGPSGITHTQRPEFIGTGEPAAVVTVYDENGEYHCSSFVATDGTWSCVGVEGLPFGSSKVTVEQNADGSLSSDDIEFAVAPVDLTVEVDALDNDAHAAHLIGTGHPGATVIIDGPEGSIETTVDADGTWSANVAGLVDGDNTLPVTQKVDGADDQTVELTVTIVAGPIANPLVAGTLLAAAGIPFMIRRRKALRV